MRSFLEITAALSFTIAGFAVGHIFGNAPLGGSIGAGLGASIAIYLKGVK